MTGFPSPYATIDHEKYWRGLISEFNGEHFFLSNFFAEPFEVGGKLVKSAEHAYQAQKGAGQPSVQQVILDADNPAWAKRLGKRVKLRPDWERVKVPVMREILRCKFPSAPDDGSGTAKLSRWLLETGGYHLVEGNDWGDTFWGCCHPAENNNLWVGSNWLGILLMERRKQLQGEIPY